MGLPRRIGQLERGGMVLLVCVLSACSTTNSTLFKSKKVDYQSEAKTLPQPNLDVPPDLTPAQEDDRYSVPGEDTQTYSQYQKKQKNNPTEAVSAGTQQVLPKTSSLVSIERDGAQRWLVIHESPQVLWPKLRDFWMKEGFTLTLDNPKIGIMETNWNENSANLPQDFVQRMLSKVITNLYSSSLRDRFRTRVEQGKTPGTAEVFITHKGMEEVLSNDASTSVWEARPADPELEDEFIRRLALSLGVQQPLIDKEIKQDKQIALQAKKNNAVVKEQAIGDVLTLNDPFDRAWRSVGLALDRAGFTVQDRDREEGVYYVRYTDTEGVLAKKPGFFDRLAFWRSEDKSKETQTYRVKVVAKGVGAPSEVLVRNELDQPIPKALNQEILKLIKDQLQ
ncbi:outer membrane protein assembly factor BamC [Ferrovum sp. JA12]|uniref:outer membrane protein assembly factor BamC n=1 Tax=Ferrovum sp. JA12 TaxID=1356299 RepID=UPI000702767A|nr:outer membrane protein assembly factor BamC [Ferrovum sp. JA12]KRH78032.1 outer membrane protein assembly factor BamC [Ferrovum sp. JA12]